MLGDSYITATGVILSREQMGENSLWVRLFLRGYGIMNVTAPYGKGGFGGDNEPFVWGVFDLQKKQRSRNYFIYDIDVNDDMLRMRQSRDTITTALKWAKTVIKYLAKEQPDDELLANLYWCMKLLCFPAVPADVSDWRFLWRWLKNWGLAPDIIEFHQAKNFTHDEIVLLTQIDELNTQGVIKLFSFPINLKIRENTFKVASRLAMNFLNEK